MKHKKSPQLLMVYPAIYDFAAYDLWLKPLGFLQIKEILQQKGINVTFVDMLDRNHRALLKYKLKNKNRPFGTGKFINKKVEKPEVLKHIPKQYKRYGMPLEIFQEIISSRPGIDAILRLTASVRFEPLDLNTSATL